MSLIVIDTQILIWAVKREATAGQEPMIEKATRYLEYLDKCKDRIIIPSVVVSEFLANVPDDREAAVLQALQERFMIMPFDTLAAVYAARVWRKNSEGNPEFSSSKPKTSRKPKSKPTSRSLPPPWLVDSLPVRHPACR